MGTGDIGDSKDYDAAASADTDGVYSSDSCCYYDCSHNYYHPCAYHCQFISVQNLCWLMTIENSTIQYTLC